MKRLVCVFVLVCASLAFAAPSKYDIRILDERTPAALYRPEYEPLEKLVGKTVEAIFGPISEIRVEVGGVNLTGIEKDPKKLDERVRERIDRAKCIGQDSEVEWHRAPWLRGYLLLENGRILPVEFLLDAVVAGGLFFAENAPDD